MTDNTLEKRPLRGRCVAGCVLRETQRATHTSTCATRNATPCATPDLKSLANKVLRRNPSRNSGATKMKKGRNFLPLYEAAKVAPVSGDVTPLSEPENAAPMRTFHYRLTDTPETWLVLLAPGCNVVEARQVLVQTFGAGRVAEVVDYPRWGKGGGQ